MGTISIFGLEFSGVKFACARSFDGAYRLQAGDYVVSMTPDAAHALAEGGARIRTKAQVAKYFDRALKPGATFRRDLLAVDGRVAHIEIGVTDAGDGLYIEVGAGRITLTDAQAATLLAVLGTLERDVAAIYRASAGPQDLTVAQGLRGFLFPWEVDPTW
jgi:hypothetical protein